MFLLVDFKSFLLLVITYDTIVEFSDVTISKFRFSIDFDSIFSPK